MKFTPSANVGPAQPVGNKAARRWRRPNLMRSKAAGTGKPNAAPPAEKRYTLTFSVNIQNLLNSTNLNQPRWQLEFAAIWSIDSHERKFWFWPERERGCR